MMHKDSIFKNFIFAICVILFLVFTNSWGYLTGIKSGVLRVLSPLESNFMSSSNVVSDLAHTIKNIGDFKDENKRLQEENHGLNYELAKMKETQKENESLKSQLKFKNNLCGDYDCINMEIGRIIGRSPESYGNFIFINLGAGDGAKAGEAITIKGGIMIGKITEAFNDYSKVMLVVSPESSVNCLAQTTRANGLMYGKYGTSAMLEKVGQSEDLVQGDIVITSGLESGIPKGLILGKISKIEQSPNMVFKSADIELFADFGHIEEIYLIKQNEG